MEILKDLFKKLKGIDLDSLIQEIIATPEIERLIIDLNFNKQLFEKGIDVDGEEIGYYSLFTEYGGGAEKGKFYNEPYNFDDTGDLKRSFNVDSLYKDFEIEASTEKMDDNESIRTAQILGLTDPNMQILINAIKPLLIEKINGILL